MKTLYTNVLQLLPIDHHESSTDWNLSEQTYDNGETVRHVSPNKGAHSYGMKTNEEGLPESTCHCTVEYDESEEGILIVIHNAEPELAVG